MYRELVHLSTALRFHFDTAQEWPWICLSDRVLSVPESTRFCHSRGLDARRLSGLA